MKIYSIQELVTIAREKSPFYKKLYSSVPRNNFRIENLPIVDHSKFWKANTIINNQLLTGAITEGIVLKSGGTTGAPKFSVFTWEEWDASAETFGQTLAENGFEHGDRVANIFYGGQLYASFLFTTKCLEKAPVKTICYPIMGSTSVPEIVKMIEEHDINVIAGVPTRIVEIAKYAMQHHTRRLNIQKIFFAGESMYPDQHAYLEGVFPGVQIRSFGYASTDSGLLGYADQACGYNEHRVFGKQTTFEIVDEKTGEIINQPNQPGKVIITNLMAILMPIIRYPAGDRACWIEPPGNPDRKFKILGRSEEGARIGTMTLYYEDMRRVLDRFREPLGISNFQMRMIHKRKKDQIVLRIASSQPREILEKVTEEIVDTVYNERPRFIELIESNNVSPLAIEWIDSDQLIRNLRTGKLRKIIDNRE